MDALLEALLARVPDAIGAVVCDDEGETVVSALGGASHPSAAEARAREHVPRSMALRMPVGEFLIRLAGAEVCALLRTLDVASRAMTAGRIRWLHVAYQEVDLVLCTLPEDYYLVTVLRRPSVIGATRRYIERVAQDLAKEIRE